MVQADENVLVLTRMETAHTVASMKSVFDHFHESIAAYDGQVMAGLIQHLVACIDLDKDVRLALDE